MEILIVTHKLNESLGGMQKVCRELYHGLSEKCKTHIINLDKDDSRFKYYTSLKYRIEKYLKSNLQIELVYFNDAFVGMLCAKIRKKVDAKFVVTAHGLDIVFPNYFYQKWLRNHLIHFDQIICVSEFTKTQVLNLGIEPNKIRVIENGVDKNDSYPVISEYRQRIMRKKISLREDDYKIILATGRAVRRKGFSWFIKEVLPSLPDNVLFVIAGPMNSPYSTFSSWLDYLPSSWRTQFETIFSKASDSNEIYKLMNHATYGKKFIHLGKVSQADLNALYTIADLYVMPNVKVKGDAEGFGLVALEAAVRGKVVLASDLEGITQAIQNGKNGLLLPSIQADQWIITITELLMNDEFRRGFGQNAKEYTHEQFSWTTMVGNYYDCFTTVLGDPVPYGAPFDFERYPESLSSVA